MRSFLTTILNLKHWQLFAIFFGFPLILQFETLNNILTMLNEVLYNSLYPILIICWFELYFLWLYSMAINLHKKLPPNINMNINVFKLFLFIPALYIMFFIIYLFFFMNSNSSTSPILIFLTGQTAIHLFVFICLIYSIYFIAKLLTSIETQKNATIKDYIAEIFLMWFYPIGVWIIQPRINAIFNEEK